LCWAVARPPPGQTGQAALNVAEHTHHQSNLKTILLGSTCTSCHDPPQLNSVCSLYRLTRSFIKAAQEQCMPRASPLPDLADHRVHPMHRQLGPKCSKAKGGPWRHPGAILHMQAANVPMMQHVRRHKQHTQVCLEGHTGVPWRADRLTVQTAQEGPAQHGYDNCTGKRAASQRTAGAARQTTAKELGWGLHLNQPSHTKV
jgi:hypothetical protein